MTAVDESGSELHDVDVLYVGHTLQAIAEQSGYRSAFYLSRVFSTHTGQSPSEYRRTSRV